MKRFLYSESFKRLVIIAAVLFAGVLCASFSHKASSPLTSVLGTVFSPLQKISASIAENLDGLSASFVSSSVYKEKNEGLEAELAEYRKKLADYDELKKKMKSYEALYGVKQENPDYKFCAASVISRDAADSFGSFVLNAGSKDGVSVDDPVIYGDYVLGIVKKVNSATCVVYSVLDPRVKIGAYESGTREYGYVCGDEELFKRGLCRLTGLDTSTSVVSGGVVCTSGAGGVFPNGLIIGEVNAVKNDDVSTAFYAEVKPFAEFENVSDVFVITDFEGKGDIN